jgi:hypothetical protein
LIKEYDFHALGKEFVGDSLSSLAAAKFSSSLSISANIATIIATIMAATMRMLFLTLLTFVPNSIA